jgi:hypothetical protein
MRFGELVEMLAHRPAPGALIGVFLVCQVLRNLEGGGRLPAVKRAPLYRRAAEVSVMWAPSVYAQNVVFWPADIMRPDPNGELCAFYREADTRIEFD